MKISREKLKYLGLRGSDLHFTPILTRGIKIKHNGQAKLYKTAKNDLRLF